MMPLSAAAAAMPRCRRRYAADIDAAARLHAASRHAADAATRSTLYAIFHFCIE